MVMAFSNVVLLVAIASSTIGADDADGESRGVGNLPVVEVEQLDLVPCSAAKRFNACDRQLEPESARCELVSRRELNEDGVVIFVM